MEIDIESLTVKQLREIAAVAAGLGILTTASGVPKSDDLSGRVNVPVLVCTDKRGVVFGYTRDPNGEKITLTNARMCLYWSADVGGVFGLAEKGPTKDCKISAIAPSITLSDITAVFSVDEAAVKAWTKAPVQGR